MENISPQEFKALHEADELKSVEISAEAKSADPSLEAAKVFEYVDSYDRKMNPIKKTTMLKPLEELKEIEAAQIRDLEATRYQIELYKQ
jgi:hypothetical protein